MLRALEATCLAFIVVWLVLVIAVHIVSAFIHLLLLCAVVALIMRLVIGARAK